jgi:hypothetical protein
MNPPLSPMPIFSASVEVAGGYEETVLQYPHANLFPGELTLVKRARLLRWTGV